LNKVPPAELEDLIRSIPTVEDVAVIGIDDVKSGELPRAYIVLKQGKDYYGLYSQHFLLFISYQWAP
jgi:acyl-CoA synthetase (AMP-forming)/AMP-acid ligase II